MRWLLLLQVGFFIVHLTTSEHDELIAETKLGKYKGHYLTTMGGLQVVSFNGIRYAKQPKRFQEAEMVDDHDGIVDASEDGHDCLQISHNYNKYPFEESIDKKSVGSEDCLFMNIYTPNLKPSKKYPVMFYIHGGGFMIGTGASNWQGPELLLDREVILVSFNYRLDIFGFLSVDDDVLPGNYGLKDQSLALHWVKENIAAFGGDPDSITIFGESAGSASVHLQMKSSRNKGLITRAISQSGTIDSRWALNEKSRATNNALKIAAALKCPTEPRDLLNCLQGKTADEILDASLSLKRLKIKLEMIFVPVLEAKETGFITKKDLETESTIPWLSGVNSGEGIIIYAEFVMSGDKSLTDFNKNSKKLLPILFNYENHPKHKKISQLIKKYYVGDSDFTEENIKPFINMFTDLFTFGQLKSAQEHKGKLYFYLFDHEGERSLKALAQLQHLDGACHADDLFYMFSNWKLYPKLQFNQEDTKVVKLIVDMWTNFAIYGDPTPDKDSEKWYESESGKIYAIISKDGIKLSKNLYSTRFNFWDNLIKDYIKIDSTKTAKDEL